MTKQIPSDVLEVLTAALIVLDETGKIRYLNPAAETLLRASFRQLSGQSVEEVLPFAPDFTEKIRQSLITQEAYTESAVQMVLALAHEVTVDYHVTPYRNEAGTPALLLELRQVDRQMRIHREEELLNQQKVSQAMLRGLAHEIKNPLGGLRGAAQLLERELPDLALKDYTQVIIDEADRLKTLVDRMLAPSRRLTLTAINIHEVLEHCRQLVSAEDTPDIAFVTDYDPSLPDLEADREQLIQALLNIVGNAKEAVLGQTNPSPSGRITLRTRAQRNFTIGNHRHRLLIRVDVIDNGPGVAPELVDRLFYPMVTGRATGTGLGLTIAQELVNRHGGLIEFNSQPGLTRFSVFLPLEFKYE